MPCDSIRTVSVDLSALGRIDGNLLAQALNDLRLGASVAKDANGNPQIVYFGNNEWINVQTGQSRFLATRDQNEIKRAYGRQVVISQCKKFGWAYKETERGQFTVTKR